MRIIKLYIGALLAALLFTGCSALPGLRLPEQVQISTNSLTESIASAQTLQFVYSKNIDVLAKDLDDNTKFNLIDGSALAAASIFNGNKNFLRLFGLAGGASLAVDGTFSPATQMSTYESGYSGLTCMVNLARVIVRESNDLESYSASKSGFVQSINKSLSLGGKVQAQTLTTDGDTVTTMQDDPANLSKQVLFSSYQKSLSILQASDAVEPISIFRDKVIELDHALRKKIRGTLKPQGATGFRDQLISQALEAQKKKDEAAAALATVDTLRSVTPSLVPQELIRLTVMAKAAANKVSFITDLATCLGSSGL